MISNERWQSAGSNKTKEMFSVLLQFVEIVEFPVLMESQNKSKNPVATSTYKFKKNDDDNSKIFI